VGECIKTESATYHKKCFACTLCNKGLTKEDGQTKFGKPYCKACAPRVSLPLLSILHSLSLSFISHPPSISPKSYFDVRLAVLALNVVKWCRPTTNMPRLAGNLIAKDAHLPTRNTFMAMTRKPVIALILVVTLLA
jgi:hypothetical protein